MIGPEIRSPTWARGAYSLALGAVHYLGIPALLLAARRHRRGAIILCYHGVQEPSGKGFDVNRGKFVPAHAFENQLRFLKRNFPIVPLRHIVERLEGRETFEEMVVAITFDDGYENTLTQAYPILDRYGVPATVLLATGYIGNAGQVWWNEAGRLISGCTESVELSSGRLSGRYDLSQLKEKWRLFGRVRYVALSHPHSELEESMVQLRERVHPDGGVHEDEDFLSWEDVRSLARGGLVEIGSHTVSHAIATHLPSDVLERELRESKASIESAIGKEVISLAYPNGQPGDYSCEVAATAKRVGYKCGLTTVGGVVSSRSEPFQLRRISIFGQESWPTFVSKIAGIDSWVRPAARTILGRRRNHNY